jgi:hypothetical protein
MQYDTCVPGDLAENKNSTWWQMMSRDGMLVENKNTGKCLSQNNDRMAYKILLHKKKRVL